MLGFSCKRFNSLKPATFDKRTKDTILYIFDGFLKQYPDDAFVYICDNSDGRARNRRITFGRWFNESNTVYEQHHFHIKYLDTDWYSTLLFNRSNNYKN
ncbi:hypothetical protein E2R66_27105 [Mucilaginibacter psychrotolerans]|uniref:Uncharacterized protein n=2 Tax=Mucilaginibacter psychrotolerans TaxID=1524096 RepID=A0A4Y8S2A5_9SPHI|nr:hypothetical protein E2R66_27105 [Mucilaginibacter psychrotolerans]